MSMMTPTFKDVRSGDSSRKGSMMKFHMKVQHFYLAALSLLIIGGVSIQARKQMTSVQGRTQDQAVASVLDQVEPVCRAALPEYETLHFNVNPQSTYYKGGRSRQLWSVDCLDSRKHLLMHIIWDAVANQMVVMSRNDNDAAQTTPPVNRRDALAKAKRWAHTLNLGSEADLAHCNSAVYPNGDIMFVRLLPPSGEVMIWVSIKSGNIVNTHVRNAEVHPDVLHNPRYIATDKTIPPHA